MKNQPCNIKGIISKVVIACGSLLLTFTAMAIESAYTLDNKSKGQVVTSIISELEQGYIFPKKAREVGSNLLKRLQKNEYQNINDANVFAETLTEHLQLASGDKHLQVEFSDRFNPVGSDIKAQEARAKFELDMWRSHNFGFKKIERMTFNIGYLELSAFGPVKEVGTLLASAMNLLSNTDSLIIDLRGNFGGNEQTVQLLSSYFLNQRTHLLNMVRREGNRTDQHWSSDYVEGKRYGEEKDIYILIDKNSFSAAEDFSYTMKNLKRATLIGETSGGAANSGESVRLSGHFNLFLPNARGVSPITKTNWEGTGVTPDIKVLGEDALKKAQRIILTKLIANEQDSRRIERIKKRISEL